jgi:hypothetical protein
MTSVASRAIVLLAVLAVACGVGNPAAGPIGWPGPMYFFAPVEILFDQTPSSARS